MAEIIHTVEGMAYWAALKEPKNNKYATGENNKKQWSLALYVDARNKKLLESLNLTMSLKHDDIGDRFNFSKNWKTTTIDPKTGQLKPMVPPKILDCDLNDVTSTVSIGNGSKVEVEFILWEMKSGAAEGKNKAIFNNVQIIDLVTYQAPSPLKKRADGYVSTEEQNLEEVM